MPRELTVEDLYQQYAGRASDPEGLAFWQAGFGDTIDPSEIASFQQSVATNVANGVESSATGTNYNPYFTANPDVAAEYMRNTQGLTPEQFAATHYSNYGVNEERAAPGGLTTGALSQVDNTALANSLDFSNSAALSNIANTDYSALAGYNGIKTDGGGTTGALTAATTGLQSTVLPGSDKYDVVTTNGSEILDYEGSIVGFNPNTTKYIDKATGKEVTERDYRVGTGQGTAVDTLASQIVGQGSTDRWQGQGHGSADANATDMAKILNGIGITDLSQFGQITQQVPNILPDGAGGYYEDGYTTQQVFGNTVTGQALPNTYGERQTGNAWGGTYAGKGNTAYRVDMSTGKPIFYTTGASSSNIGDFAPLLAVASFIPGVAPFAQALNAAIAIDSGDVLGGLASLAGMGGFTDVATGLRVANAVDKGDLGALASTLLQNPNISNLAGTTMLTDTISLADVGHGANIAINLADGNLPGLLNSAGALTGSSDLKVAAAGVTIVTELSKDNPNFGVIAGAARSIDNATSSASNNITADTIGGITNRVVDDLVTQNGGTDIGSAAYIAAINSGATETEALDAANAVTGAASGTTGAADANGVVVNKVADAGANTSVITGPTTNVADTEFGDLQGAINTNAMDDAVRADELNVISSLPKFSDAYSQARSLLGPNKTFTWNGKEYSTATEAERPDLTGKTTVAAATDQSAAETNRLTNHNASLVTGNAPNQSAAETTRLANLNAGLKSMEKTSFLGQVYKDLNDQFKLNGEAANDYLKNNPDSPITNSISTAFEAAGNLQKNVAGGVALLLDNKPLSDALVAGGDRLTQLGQSIGTGPQDTKNWNDTLGLIDKAKGFEKLAVMAGRIMDGNSGLGRQVEVELRQELPGLFLGGGSVKGIMLATGAMDTAETAGNAALDAYDAAVKNGKTHADALSEARTAGAVAGATEAAVQLTLGKLADFGAGKIGNVAGKAGTKVVGEGIVEGGQEGGAAAAVDLVLGNDMDANKYLTQTVVGGAVGKGAATATSGVDAAQTTDITTAGTNLGAVGAEVPGAKTVTGNDLGAIGSVTPGGNTVVGGTTAVGDVGASAVTGTTGATVTADNTSTTNITNNVTTQIGSGADASVVVGDTVTGAISAGSNASTAVGSTVTAAVTAGGNASTVVGSAVTAATTAGANVDTTVASSVSSAIAAGANANTVVTAAADAAIAAGNNVTVASNANTTTVTNATTNTTTTVNNNTGVATTVDANTNVTTTVDANTGTTTAVDANTGTTTQTTVNSNNNTQTTVVTDVNTNTQITVKVNTNTGDVIEEKETVIPDGWTPPVIDSPVIPETSLTSSTTATPETKSKSTAKLSKSGSGAAIAGGAMGLPSGFDMDPASLGSKVTQGKIDPLARVKEAQAELERDVMMNQIDPRLLSVMQQRMDPNQQSKQLDQDVGALAKMLSGESPNPSAPANEGKYYSYGGEDSIDDILGGKAANYKAGGFVEPLKASGGMVLPLLAKSGGALGKYNGREDFKGGKHVAGEGDGQSDDIPAWLADGEFVFPADVVSALGNGSTKAGTDKLYEMMHGIRDRARSKGPKDLPPPALKSALDYLKSSKRSSK